MATSLTCANPLAGEHNLSSSGGYCSPNTGDPVIRRSSPIAVKSHGQRTSAKLSFYQSPLGSECHIAENEDTQEFQIVFYTQAGHRCQVFFYIIAHVFQNVHYQCLPHQCVPTQHRKEALANSFFKKTQPAQSWPHSISHSAAAHWLKTCKLGRSNPTTSGLQNRNTTTVSTDVPHRTFRRIKSIVCCS